MRKPLVAGNWKMNGTQAQAQALAQAVRDGVGSLSRQVDVALFPSYVHLPAVLGSSGAGVVVGAQDVDEHDAGAYTGAVSAAMLEDLGCAMVIVGHSERRSLYGDDDARVAAKFEAVQKCRMQPVLCVGETLQEREAGATEAVVVRQLMAVVNRVGLEAVARAVIAYEPVWAIGTGRTATPAQAQEVHGLLRGALGEAGETVRILYGGSVKPDNAAQLFSQADIDGGLIGGASLDAASFLTICEVAATQ